MTFLAIIRIIFGSLYILFIPGFLLTFIFFKKKSKEIDWLERITLSFALSIAVVPLVVFLCNLLGLRITTLNIAVEILWTILLSVGWIFFQKTVYYQKLAQKLNNLKLKRKKE